MTEQITSAQNSSGPIATSLPRPKEGGLFIVIILLSVIVTFTAVGIVGFSYVRATFEKGLGEQLRSSLTAGDTAIELWAENTKAVASSWANTPSINNSIVALVEQASQLPAVTPENLAKLSLATHVREELRHVVEQHGYVGFLVIAPNGMQLAGLIDHAVGQHISGAQHSFLRRVFAGETVISLPFISDIPLPDEHGKLAFNQPTMLVASPIANRGGQIIAALAFRLQPTRELGKVLESIRTGNSGETYSFDRNGIFLSDSRFTADLQRIGLLSHSENARTALSLSVRDPGGNLFEGYVPLTNFEQQPLTFMAQEATQGRSGTNTSGYRDYRGVPVVGAWKWIDDMDFGIVTEVDFREAYAPLNRLKIIFGIMFVLLSVTTSAGLIYFERQRRSAQQLGQVLQSLRQTIDSLGQEVTERREVQTELDRSLGRL